MGEQPCASTKTLSTPSPHSGENTILEITPNKNYISEIIEFRNLLWGPVIRLDVFRRWSQGM